MTPPRLPDTRAHLERMGLISTHHREPTRGRSLLRGLGPCCQEPAGGGQNPAGVQQQQGGRALRSAGSYAEEGNRSGPAAVFLPPRMVECVSPHTLLLSLPTAGWQALESTCSDSHHPLPPPSTRLLRTG
ncbi:hypothetical protein HJG60_010799 [Phyllostomus discolor]|uniref:Uncharacterized protein n=1 Tax=Phyllostomus discolor TaxID=89673 RepID=A0A834EA46_9CHIR|nr:hypothetical protein HJG60_010799 [Phyllostomus discolor]